LNLYPTHKSQYIRDEAVRGRTTETRAYTLYPRGLTPADLQRSAGRHTLSSPYSWSSPVRCPALLGPNQSWSRCEESGQQDLRLLRCRPSPASTVDIPALPRLTSVHPRLLPLAPPRLVLARRSPSVAPHDRTHEPTLVLLALDADTLAPCLLLPPHDPNGLVRPALAGWRLPLPSHSLVACGSIESCILWQDATRAQRGRGGGCTGTAERGPRRWRRDRGRRRARRSGVGGNDPARRDS
jgi:hypothetical protein